MDVEIKLKPSKNGCFNKTITFVIIKNGHPHLLMTQMLYWHHHKALLSVSAKYMKLCFSVKTQKGPFCTQGVSTLTLGSGCWANSRATKGQNTGIYLFWHKNNEKVPLTKCHREKPA